jgi:hypothetical protein
MKMAGLFINISFKVIASLMSLRGVAWLACMQNVGTLMILGECSTRCHLETCGDLNCHDIGTCEMKANAEGTGTIQQMQQEGVHPDSVTFLGC